MKPFIVNRHGQIVLPFNFFPALDPTPFESLEEFEAVIRRDFEKKGNTEAEIVSRIDTNAYRHRYDLLRDLASNLFWANRYLLTLYEKRAMRWRDVPRRRRDVFLPTVVPVTSTVGTVAIDRAYRRLHPAWDEAAEQTIFGLLRELFELRRAAPLSAFAVAPTVPQALADPHAMAYEICQFDADHPVHSWDDVVSYRHATPELEALMRHAMVLRSEFPWRAEQARLRRLTSLDGDEVVLVLQPKTPEVRRFLERVSTNGAHARHPHVAAAARHAAAPVPPVDVRRRYTVRPRIEALATALGEYACTNDDVVRNAAYCWAPMSADDIRVRTGIERRTYTTRALSDLALDAAMQAVDRSGRRPEEFGAVIFGSCTNVQLMPSVAAWLSAQLGMLQTHASFDLVAACAGLPYAIGEAVRLMEETSRPILVVLAEKFSDKIGTVRTSRMLFGDGAAALVLGNAPAGTPADIEFFQTYASGPISQVGSIVLPNPEFDYNVTVFGPEVRALVRRYLEQMMTELKALPHPDGTEGSLLDAIDLVVPHQANKPMVLALADAVGLPSDRFYFDIERVGNTSAASIPIALQDAVGDGVLKRPTRVFAPGFGAGAAAGYVVARIDPAVIVGSVPHEAVVQQMAS